MDRDASIHVHLLIIKLQYGLPINYQFYSSKGRIVIRTQLPISFVKYLFLNSIRFTLVHKSLHIYPAVPNKYWVLRACTPYQ